MAAVDEPEDAYAEEPDDLRPRRPRQGENDPNYNPYLAFAGIFKDDPFIDDIDACIEADRQRERDEAARLADLEDAQAVAAKEGHNRRPKDGENGPDYNPYLALAGIFEDDPFMDELDAYVQEGRQRQRDEAAAEADREDVARATDDKEGPTMAAINNAKDMRVEAPDGTYASPSRRDENDPEYNPYIAFAGIFKDDPFAAEVEAYWQAERQRERDEAARLADLEDAARIEMEVNQSNAINAISDAK